MSNRKVLNVGGNSREIALPPQYDEFAQVLLDIDPKGTPDIVCDARNLASLQADQFDAVYCSHNLEHYYRHEVPLVLRGIMHVLKPDGFAHILVPDVLAVMQATLANNLDIDDMLYQSPAGPIMVSDVLYGYSVEIEQSGQDYYAHKTGFSHASLKQALQDAGFSYIFSRTGNFEITALAFTNLPNKYVRDLFRLPETI